MLGACSPMMKAVYGLKKSQIYNTSDVANWAQKNNFSENNLFLLDTLYFQFIKEQPYTALEQKDMIQPIMLFYVKNNKIQALTNNCQYAGFPNLKWNSYGEFNEVVPKTVCNISGYTELLFSDITKFYIPINKSSIKETSFIVLHLTNMLNRQGKRLYNMVTEKYPDIPVYVVNCDTWFKAHSE